MSTCSIDLHRVDRSLHVYGWNHYVNNMYNDDIGLVLANDTYAVECNIYIS